jgi:thymidylate synthase ThyX
MYSSKILADSVSPDGVRLTTMEVCFPRIVLAEFNTHRMFSRNSASSRAIPVEKMLKLAQEHPYIPEEFGSNQKGMQAGDALTGYRALHARGEWLQARDNAVYQASKLLELGVHKQLTNRLLEPFMWHTVIVSATDWSNFFHLRTHEAAHPAIREIALMMEEDYNNFTPKRLDYGEWHLPLVDDEDLEAFSDHDPAALPSRERMLCSAGRCARVSYLTHDGRRDVTADIALAVRLLESGHMSPFEHVARPMTEEEIEQLSNACAPQGYNGLKPYTGIPFSGNFCGWVQYRKTIEHEDDMLGARE